MTERILRRLADRGVWHPCIYRQGHWRAATDGCSLLAVRDTSIAADEDLPEQIAEVLFDGAFRHHEIPMREIRRMADLAPLARCVPCPHWGEHEAANGRECDCYWTPLLGWAVETMTPDMLRHWVLIRRIPYDRVRIAEILDGWPNAPTLVGIDRNGALRFEQSDRIAAVMRGVIPEWDALDDRGAP
jgi:hypothetical protein